jgi:hypothetical protein
MKMFPAGALPLKNKHGTPTRLLNKGRPAARVAHLSAPLKGLSRFAELSAGDPMLASILTNWIVLDDRISVRPSYFKVGQIAANTAISTMIPYYSGNVDKLAAASGGKIYDLSGVQISAGPYGGDNWAWVSYSNLSTTDYTVMVNGHDGVISWDGTTFAAEVITVPAAETWINPLRFDKVISHMNRLWFADSDSLAVYYLPIGQKAGAVELFPLDVLFTRGGRIAALHTWSIDGGKGLDDALAVFTDHGECAIYSGVDPESDFKLVGVFRFDAPMSHNSIINFGGDLFVLVSTGLVPMTTLMRAETENLGRSDLNVTEEFETISKNNRDTYGWQVLLNSHTGHAICNMPLNNGKYQQMVRKMSGQIWSKWEEVPSRCWGWLDNHTYFGTDTGGIYRGGTEYLSDDGLAINADVRFAWSGYKSVAKKNFKLLRLYTLTDGIPRPFMDLEVDYDNTLPTNQPEVSTGPSGGADWNVATWDVDYWALSTTPRQNWQGITGLGRVGAPRIRISVSGCTYSLSGVDVLYELGGLM